MSLENRLEQYTLQVPQEVLLVTLETDGQPDRVVIFKGFSSSLMNPTAYDPDVPVIGDRARILSVDRLRSPYYPDNPQIIQQGLTWPEMEQILEEKGL